MRKVNEQDLVKALSPEIAAEGKNKSFSGIGTDTRKDLSGQLFWALKGEAFDAHNFLPEAIRKGASGLVVQALPKDHATWSGGIAIYKVADTLKALQSLARYYRRQDGYQVLGITGSNGKTSTKEFAASIIAPEKKLHWNPGSFNNHFGLPFNLIQAPTDAEVVLAEMGMNHAGELTELCKIAEPDTVLCTMVGVGHIEHFGTVDKIAQAKEEIYQNSPAEALRIYNLDNEWTRKMWERSKQEYPKACGLWGFSNQKDGAEARVYLKAVKMTAQGIEVEGRLGEVRGKTLVPVLGLHNVINLAAAASLALSLEIPAEKIWKNFSLCKAHWGRMQLVKTQKGFQILFDGYNANPESMKAMLASLKDISVPGKRYAVLAQMKELGGESAQEHRNLGEQAAHLGFEKVWFYGPDAKAFEEGFKKISKNLMISDNYEEKLASQLRDVLDPKDLVVVKGSRGMETERFVLHCQPLDFKKK